MALRDALWLRLPFAIVVDKGKRKGERRVVEPEGEASRWRGSEVGGSEVDQESAKMNGGSWGQREMEVDREKEKSIRKAQRRTVGRRTRGGGKSMERKSTPPEDGPCEENIGSCAWMFGAS